MKTTYTPDHCLLVIFGASGDLTKRKLVPALYELCRNRQLPRHCGILGVSRTKMTDDQFREKMKPWCEKQDGFTEESWAHFRERLHYEPCDATELKEFQDKLKPRIEALSEEHETRENVLFYLSVAPGLYDPIIMNIGATGMVTEGKRWCSLNREHAPWQRIIVEKPFGHDLKSAEHLNRVLGRVFEEEAIFRIDHYLGKETVQNLLVFRFANSIWEPLWNRMYVDHVQITAAETVGVEGRGSFYEKAGALRDMIQSHLLQVMAVLAMEPPTSHRAADLRVEQRKVLEAVRPLSKQQVPTAAVRGQYAGGEVDGKTIPGYREEEDVADDSQTDTFAALRVQIDNWRWEGVPFFLRTGKAMHRKLTQIVVTFKPTPHQIFTEAEYKPYADRPNRLVINVQPDEGINLKFKAKVPGTAMTIDSAVLDFDYMEKFGGQQREAYGHLLLDAMQGDQSLFKDRHEIEAAWRIVTPVMEHWAEHPQDDLPNYEAGSWGPAAADALIAGHGEWRNPVGEISRSRLVSKR